MSQRTPSKMLLSSAFDRKLLKNTKEIKQGLVKICWERTREKMI